MREYWYIGSIETRSETAKKRQAASYDTSLYSRRAVLIFCSVISAIACFSLISLDFSFEAVSTLMASSSVSMFFLPESTCSIFSSISKSYFLLSAESIINLSLSSSSSGRSFLTKIPSSWSFRPSYVIMKFKRVTFVETSGR